MATFEKVFVRTATSPLEAVASLRRTGRHCKEIRRVSSVGFDSELPWLVIDSYYPAIVELGRVLSESSGSEVLCVSLQTVVDAFGFWRYVDGGFTRSLVFGLRGDEERVWNGVRGEPEPWEAEVIFRASEDLEAIIKDIEDHPRELVERVYRERSFMIGIDLPRVGFNAAGLVDGIHRHYRLPRLYPQSVRFGPLWPLRRIAALWR